MPEPVVIIGAGPAGCAAAVQCLRLGVRPRLLDRSGRAGGLVFEAQRVDNYPGLNPLPGPVFAERLADHLARFGIEVERATVTSLASCTGTSRARPAETASWSPGADTAAEEAGDATEPARGAPAILVRGDFDEIEARGVILATGTVARPLDVPGAAALAGSRLFYSVRELLTALPSARRALIIGGGEAALDYALTLAEAGARVRVLVRGTAVRAIGRLADRVRENPAIEIVTEVTPLGLERDDAGVRLAVGVASPVPGQHEIVEHGDAILVAIGRESTAQRLLENVSASPIFGVRSALSGLFIIGDARSGGLGQIAMATGDGIAAAMTLVVYIQHAQAGGRLE
jgi:thioredoxin reductase (NADPH)